MQPAVGIDGLGGFFRQVEVTHEHIRAAHQDFTGHRVQTHLVELGRRANGAGFDAVGGRASARTTGLGHAPEFQHGQAKCQIPTHQIGGNGGCTRDQKARTVDADHFAHIVQRQQSSHMKAQLQAEGHRLLRQH